MSPCDQYSLEELARTKMKMKKEVFIIYEKWPGQK
jgi:hypothetical protein